MKRKQGMGHVLRRMRKAKDMTQVELAERVGVTREYITMLETGAKKNPSLDVLKRLVKALGVPVSSLSEGKGGPGMVRFFSGEERNADFEEWVRANPNAFVLNSYAPADPDYLMLHSVDCRNLLSSMERGKMMTSYLKVCSPDRRILEEYAESIGGVARPCRNCLGRS